MGLEDVLAKIEQNIRHNNALLGAMYKQTQQKEAQKAPHNSRAYTINVVCPTLPLPLAMQMLPRNDARKDVGLTNLGGSDLLFSEIQFDPSSILQLLNDPSTPDTVIPAPMQVIRIGLLKSGAAVTLTNAAPVWVYNLSVTNGVGALVSILEDVFSVPNRLPSPPGTDGMAFQNYKQIPGAGPDDPIQISKALS